MPTGIMSRFRILHLWQPNGHIGIKPHNFEYDVPRCDATGNNYGGHSWVPKSRNDRLLSVEMNTWLNRIIYATCIKTIYATSVIVYRANPSKFQTELKRKQNLILIISLHIEADTFSMKMNYLTLTGWLLIAMIKEICNIMVLTRKGCPVVGEKRL